MEKEDQKTVDKFVKIILEGKDFRRLKKCLKQFKIQLFESNLKRKTSSTIKNFKKIQK